MIDIFEKHKQEWDKYFDDRFVALVLLDASQWQIAKDRKRLSPWLIARWKKLMQRERRLWIETWGMSGSCVRALKEKQEAELSSVYVSPDELQEFHEIIGCQTWEELRREHEFVRDVYKQNKMDVPMATQRRMVMEIDLYRLGWNGLSPEISTGQWKILDAEDIQHEFRSWNDLWDVYFVTLYIYQKVDYLPMAFKKRMAFKIEQFWKEVDPALNHLNQ